MSSNKLILLVEDNPDDVFIFKRTLKMAQIVNQMKVMTNGREAVEYLSPAGKFADRERHPLPFLIFLDLKMPYLDGFEVLNWMRRQPALKTITVVVLSGSDEPKDLERAIRLGAQSYMVKPPQPEALRQFVEPVAGPGEKSKRTG